MMQEQNLQFILSNAPRGWLAQFNIMMKQSQFCLEHSLPLFDLGFQK